MQLAFYFDQTRCIGCHTCVVACKDWHDLPAELVSRRRVSTYEEGKFPDVGVHHVSVSCNHCEKPACAEACPEDAIYKREADGVVLIDAEKCTGCRACEDACPYGAIQFRPEEGAVAEKCCFCEDRLADGEIPICVVSARIALRTARFPYACPPALCARSIAGTLTALPAGRALPGACATFLTAPKRWRLCLSNRSNRGRRYEGRRCRRSSQSKGRGTVAKSI